MSWLSVVVCDGKGTCGYGCDNVLRDPSDGYEGTGWSRVVWPGYLRRQAHLCPDCDEVLLEESC